MSIPPFARQHVREDGLPKKAFSTERRARAHATGEGLALYPYPCTLCGKFHLSRRRHDPNRPQPEVPWYETEVTTP